MKIGPKFKIARRLGSRIFPKTQGTKFSISGSERSRSGRRPRALSEYGSQLIEKQKARLSYGLKERQFAAYVRAAKRRAVQPTAELCRLLERRLDNVVFRLGLTPSRAAGRQMVSHGHILVNGRRVNIPSYLVSAGDEIAVRAQSQNKGFWPADKEKGKERPVPEWLEFAPEGKAGKVLNLPGPGAEADINFGSILEFYRRV